MCKISIIFKIPVHHHLCISQPQLTSTLFVSINLHFIIYISIISLIDKSSLLFSVFNIIILYKHILTDKFLINEALNTVYWLKMLHPELHKKSVLFVD